MELHRPDFDLPFILQTDASEVGMAAVLYQEKEDKKFIISYASAKFNKTQQRYHINEQECLAVVWRIKKYRAYLEDQPFLLKTDNKSLLWLNSAKDSNAKLTRWFLLLQEFNFRVEHCAGKANELPDLLSRDPDQVIDDGSIESLERMFVPQPTTQREQSEALMALDIPTLLEEMKTAQKASPDYPRIINRINRIQNEGPREQGDTTRLSLDRRVSL